MTDLRLYLDDLRPTPTVPDGQEAWTRAYTAPEAIVLLETGTVTEVSLDHDLGDTANDPLIGTGYDVALWIEEHAFDGTCPKLAWRIHSANPVGISKMTAALKNADRFWNNR